MLRITANTVAKLRTEKPIRFIFTLPLGFFVEYRNTDMSTRNTELFEGVGSVMPITRACNCDVGPELEDIGKGWKENGWDEIGAVH
jgi:hypothetical protein